MNQVNKARTIEDLSQKELMDFIITLNKFMQDYDNNIEHKMKRSEKAEWDSIKSDTHTVSRKNLKRLYYSRKLNK